MNFSTGMIVVIVAMVLFYLRIAMLRGQKKRYEREYALKRRKINGRSKGAALPSTSAVTPPYGIKSWLFVGISILLIILGMLFYNDMTLVGIELLKDTALVSQLSALWYIPVAVGVLLLAFSIKIDKPRLDDD